MKQADIEDNLWQAEHTGGNAQEHKRDLAVLRKVTGQMGRRSTNVRLEARLG